MKVKRLSLVNGDEYENVELVTDVPKEINDIAPELFIGVKSKHYIVYVQKELISSFELDKSFDVISS